jgi:hypothetical protein
MGFLGVSSEGQSSPSQLISVNAVSAGINSTNNSNIDILNIYLNHSTGYELADVSYTEFRDESNNPFIDAQSVVDYINDRAQVAQENVSLFFNYRPFVVNQITVGQNILFDYKIADPGLLSIFWEESTFPSGVTVSEYDHRIVSGTISSTGDYYLQYEKANAVGITTAVLHIDVI